MTLEWRNRDGKYVLISNIDNVMLTKILNRFYRHAVLMREAVQSVHRSAEGHYFSRKVEEVDCLGWRDFADPFFFDLEQEGARRRLGWTEPTITFDQQVNMLEKGSLESRILGSLRKTINAHGPITKNWILSATKRIVGDIKSFNKDNEGDSTTTRKNRPKHQ